jgi:polyisoprenyl-phosphate glycosyltransferase
MAKDGVIMRAVYHVGRLRRAQPNRDRRDKARPMRPLPATISCVIPCYNEEENVRPLYERLVRALSNGHAAIELIFVENGSHDATQARLRELAAQDARVRVLVLSRNFGYQGGISAGLAAATGDVVVVMDADQQDPPELIPQFIEKWREGYMVVYGTRAKRAASAFYQFGYKLFYRLFRAFAYIDIPLDASDFALMDRRVVSLLNHMPERDRLIRGLRAFTGFAQTGVPYDRPERTHGTSNFRLRDYVRFAMRGILAFSYKPLEAIFGLALGTVALTIIGLIVYFVLYFVSPSVPRGFSTLILVVLFLGGVQLLSLAIIGEYVGRIFEEVKQRPIYILDQEISQAKTTRDVPSESL